MTDNLLRKTYEIREPERRPPLSVLAASSWETYGACVDAARRFYRKRLVEGEKLSSSLFFRLAELSQTDDDLIRLVPKETPDHYLYAHVCNTAIISVRMGVELGLDRDALRVLAVSAFLHDAGIDPDRLFSDDAGRPAGSPLKAPAAAHVVSCGVIGGLSPEMEGTVNEVLSQGHEWSEIISFAEVYEGLSHGRPWRPRLLPAVAVSGMLETHAQEFPTRVVQAFARAFWPYPPGSYVRLSNGWLARVLSSNAAESSKPRICAVSDARGFFFSSPKPWDWRIEPSVKISGPVDETNLLEIPRSALVRLRAQHWWVEGL